MSSPRRELHPHHVDEDVDGVDTPVADRLPAPTDQVVRPLRATAATPRRQPGVRESGWWVLAPALAGILTGAVMNLAGANALYIAAALLLLSVLTQLVWSRFRYLRRIRKAR